MTEQEKTEIFHIEQSTPEAMGIPSSSVLHILKSLEEKEITLHSLAIIRHGKLVTEAYYAPYTRDTLHRMFSITKNLTSLAIGSLQAKGMLSIHDPIIKYFPEYCPKDIHPFLKATTIRHMLMMQSCHSKTTYKNDLSKNWVKSFFTVEPDHMPGSVFNYDTSSSHTLCALVEKLSGKSLLDYLKDYVFKGLDFSEDSYVVKDPFGSSQGGTGLMASPYDMIKLGLLLMNEGNYMGKNYIDASYLKEATSFQCDTLMNGQTTDERQGYGYQFWRIRHDGFACYGMGGQLIICLPKYDLLVVTSADAIAVKGGHQVIYDTIFDSLLPSLEDKAITTDPNQEDYHQLVKVINNLKIKPLKLNEKLMNTCLVKHMTEEKVLIPETNPQDFRQIKVTIHSEDELIQNSHKNHLRHKENHLPSASLDFNLKGVDYQLPFGFGYQVESIFPIYEQKCITSATWLNEDTLYIKSHIIDECIGSIHFYISYKDTGMQVFMKKVEETLFNEFSGYLTPRS